MNTIGNYEVDIGSSVGRLLEVLNSRSDATVVWLLNTAAEAKYPGLSCLAHFLVVFLNGLRDESGAQIFQAEVGEDPRSSCTALIIQPVSQALHH